MVLLLVACHGRCPMSGPILTTSQRRCLQHQVDHTPNARVYRRALALLELDRGVPLAEVARCLRVSRQSVYNWRLAFGQHPDPATLNDDARTGRPSVWTAALQRLLRDALDRRPRYFGYAALSWTVPLLQDYLETVG